MSDLQKWLPLFFLIRINVYQGSYCFRLVQSIQISNLKVERKEEVLSGISLASAKIASFSLHLCLLQLQL